MTQRSEVVIIGAGLAGLAAAVHLTRAGIDVAVLEAGDAVGGRVRTDRRDGFRLDRGFQLLNPAYPEVPRILDLAALDLQPFVAGIAARTQRGLLVLADPRRAPQLAAATLSSLRFDPRGTVAAAGWLAQAGYRGPQWARRRPDGPLSDALDTRVPTTSSVPGARALMEVFLAGVLAEEPLNGSRRVGELFLRAFVRGVPALPAAGMQAIPEQLAAQLPAGTVRLGSPVRALSAGAVSTDDGQLLAEVIVLATDPAAAAGLAGLAGPALKALTTFYHRAPQPPATNRLLHVDLERTGPIVNTAVVSTVATTYATSGALVASTVLGLPGLAAEAAVRAQAGRIYGVATERWELVAHYPVPGALPVHRPGQPLAQAVRLADGLIVAGDHRDTPSIQGALVSGRRAAAAALVQLGRPVPPSVRPVPAGPRHGRFARG